MGTYPSLAKKDLIGGIALWRRLANVSVVDLYYDVEVKEEDRNLVNALMEDLFRNTLKLENFSFDNIFYDGVLKLYHLCAPKAQRILKYRYVDKLSYFEIAKIKGINIQAATIGPLLCRHRLMFLDPKNRGLVFCTENVLWKEKIAQVVKNNSDILLSELPFSGRVVKHLRVNGITSLRDLLDLPYWKVSEMLGNNSVKMHNVLGIMEFMGCQSWVNELNRVREKLAKHIPYYLIDRNDKELYAFKVIADVQNLNEKERQNFDFSMLDFKYFERVISMLSDRDELMVQRRYRDGMTLAEIGLLPENSHCREYSNQKLKEIKRILGIFFAKNPLCCKIEYNRNVV